MVTRTARFNPLHLLLTASLVLASGCSLKNWWGETKKPVDSVQSEVSSSECAPFESVLSTPSDVESERILECYTAKAGDVWKQLRGEKADSYSEGELTTLVQKGIISLPGDKDKTLRRIFTAKKMLGFQDSVTRVKLDDWISWAKRNRPLARSLYRKFYQRQERILYSDVKALVELLSAALQKMNWTIDSAELAHLISTALDVQDRDIRNAIGPGAEVAINFLNTLCPTFKEFEVWNTREIASCFTLMVDHFKVGAPWFEFLMNPVDDLSQKEFQDIHNVLDNDPDHDGYRDDPKRLTYWVNSWFHQRSMGILYPSRWTDLARRMGASPPNNLLDSLRVIRKFKSRSNEETIYPEAGIRIYEVAQQAQLAILSGMRPFLDAMKGRNEMACVDPKTPYWTQCQLKDINRAKTAYPADTAFPIDLVTRVKSMNHGQTSSPITGEEFSKVMFYHVLSNQIVLAFHDVCKTDGSGNPIQDVRDAVEELVTQRRSQRPAQESAKKSSEINDRAEPVKTDPGKINCAEDRITTNLGDDNDKIVQLITVGVTAGETVSHFISNITKKLNHVPIKDDASSFLNPQWNIGGFARLIAMTSDILVRRDPQSSNIAENFVSLFININPSAMSLDQLAITAILTTVDSLPQYRRTYLAVTDDAPAPEKPETNRYNIKIVRDPETHEYLVSRSTIMKNLPTLLKITFPRTYESCEKFGFEKSCGVAFDTILPHPEKGSEYIHASDLDIMTIIATGIEAVMDSCDKSVADSGRGDGLLKWQLPFGDDELDCGFNRTQEIMKRLVSSKIVNLSKGDEAKMTTILDLVNTNSITRTAGKVAMAKGSLRNWGTNIPLFWYYNEASIGSIYGLVADIANPTAARSYK